LLTSCLTATAQSVQVPTAHTTESTTPIFCHPLSRISINHSCCRSRLPRVAPPIVIEHTHHATEPSGGWSGPAVRWFQGVRRRRRIVPSRDAGGMSGVTTKPVLRSQRWTSSRFRARDATRAGCRHRDAHRHLRKPVSVEQLLLFEIPHTRSSPKRLRAPVTGRQRVLPPVHNGSQYDCCTDKGWCA
jgi:hypothetical protein